MLATVAMLRRRQCMTWMESQQVPPKSLRVFVFTVAVAVGVFLLWGFLH